jgi:hypothetical protein
VVLGPLAAELDRRGEHLDVATDPARVAGLLG